MSDARIELGRLGEAHAADFLKAKGMQIVARNWRCRFGELDLVVIDGQTLVLVEVRSASSRRFGRPEESIDARKQRKLIRLAEAYILDRSWTGAWRIDVLAIDLDRAGGLIQVRHFVSAIGP